jgi:hypothetical protein
MNTELQQRIIKQATRMFLCNGIKSVTMDMIASQLSRNGLFMKTSRKRTSYYWLVWKVRKWKEGLGWRYILPIERM